MRRYLRALWLVPALLTTPTLGQYATQPSADGLSATGSTEIVLRPTMLQMTIQIEGRSSDLPQAADELKRRVEVARKKLKELAAKEVDVSKPILKGESSPEEAQQMQAMMQQYGGGERGRQMLEQTASVSITQTVTARWPLADSDDIDRLISTKEMTRKIRDADIASTADKQPVSAAQEELAVEMAAMMEDYGYGEETSKVGEPEFRYVATLVHNEHRKALATAFEKAKRKITTLADACGVDVAKTVPVSSMTSSEGPEDFYGRSVASEPTEDQTTGDFELLTGNPIEAKCTVTVTAIGRHQP